MTVKEYLSMNNLLSPRTGLSAEERYNKIKSRGQPGTAFGQGICVNVLPAVKRTVPP